MHISTDIGGTFTDFVIFDGMKIKTFKAAVIEANDSTVVVPPDMSAGIMCCGGLIV
jgi:N-methylhydantoinase A/oxoprolinase/acetone carboxylase beta subunit